MGLRRWIWAAAAVLALGILGGLTLVWRPEIAPVSPIDEKNLDRKTIDKGAELAAIGNCSDCHTKAGGQSYAGGRVIPTPFGTIYASNLTPDVETGIGAWSEIAFRRAMHEGVDRSGRQLYPAFPYDHFTNATNEDIHALYTFLMSRPPVRNAAPANQLTFPFNVRPVIAGWKLLFLRKENTEPEPGRDAEWNRGRYLVEGLGHCGSCHTPRNALGGEKKASAYGGGVADGWNAPPLNSSIILMHHWNVDQLAEYLSTGWSRLHGAAAGPMADVARNLGQTSRSDVRAIAAYIASLAPSETGVKPVLADNPVKEAPSNIVEIYTGACAKCHNDRGDIGPSKALPLSLSTAVQQSNSANTVRVILHGIQAYRTDGGPYMPGFDGILSDAQIASLANYVRERYSHQPKWIDTNEEIAKARQEAQP